MPPDPTQDQDFLRASPSDQHAYLMSVDPDYAKASGAEQSAYLASVRSKSIAPSPINVRYGPLEEESRNERLKAGMSMAVPETLLSLGPAALGIRSLVASEGIASAAKTVGKGLVQSLGGATVGAGVGAAGGEIVGHPREGAELGAGLGLVATPLLMGTNPGRLAVRGVVSKLAGSEAGESLVPLSKLEQQQRLGAFMNRGYESMIDTGPTPLERQQGLGEFMNKGYKPAVDPEVTAQEEARARAQKTSLPGTLSSPRAYNPLSGAATGSAPKGPIPGVPPVSEVTDPEIAAAEEARVRAQKTTIKGMRNSPGAFNPLSGARSTSVTSRLSFSGSGLGGGLGRTGSAGDLTSWTENKLMQTYIQDEDLAMKAAAKNELARRAAIPPNRSQVR